ncbi:MAG: dephospho-CoA kinase [Oscillospiraceae bacterium]|nr:dephospho-CoA kinase [Oscillospiraceae bacterium]
MKKTGLLVGLTGQTGAGKTTVSGYLLRLGHRVIDADVMARHVVAKGGNCLLDLAVTFGGEIILADGTLDRKKMGDIIFSDKEKRMIFNKIIFPYIQEGIFDEVERMREDGAPIIFLDAPTLFESGTHTNCDRIISVIAPLVFRKERIISRDKLTDEQAVNRIKSQHDDEFYTSRSDYVICNDKDLGALRERVDQVIGELELGIMEDQG